MATTAEVKPSTGASDIDWTLRDTASTEARDRIRDSVAPLIRRAEFAALFYDLDWRFCNQPDWRRALLYLRDGPDGCVGFAPFLSQDRPLNFFLGEVKVLSVPMRRFTLVGEPLLECGDDASSVDAISSLLSAARTRLSSKETLYFEGLPLGGPTHKALTTGPGVARDYLLLPLGASFLHQFIRMPASYAEYLKQLGSRSRRSVQYSERELQQDMKGEVRAECFRESGAVERFLIDAERISQKTYQRNLLGLGLEATPAFRQRLEYAAARGWMRSYILYCRTEPAAFMLGYQYNGCYYYTDVGYDPQFAPWSVGSVLQLKVLQDLYSGDDRPSVFDFSTGFGSHKARFGNFERREVNLLLLPRTTRNRLLVLAYSGTEKASTKVGALLERLGVKARLKKWVRRSWPG